MSARLATAEIVSVGTEMTLGRAVDTNSAYLSRELAKLGLFVRAHATFPDDEAVFAEGLALACERADLVIVTGGLGPTRDDLTRDVVAKVAGLELVRDDAWLRHLRDRYARMERPFPESNTRQADRPSGSEIVRNRLGSAPGFALRARRALLVALPGVPREMTAMFEDEVVPMLLRRFGAGAGVIATRSLHLFGAPESEVGERIDDLMDTAKNPYAAVTVSGAVISIHLVARAASAEEAGRLVEPLDAEVARRAGPLLFGRDSETLPSAVVKLLASKGLRVALAESCTGGLATSLLSTVPGVSAQLVAGAVTYANEAKTLFAGVPAALIEGKGAVSAEVARAMAEGIRLRAGADVGLGSTGIAGPTGGTSEKPVGLVYLACAAPDGTVVERRLFPGDRTTFQDRAAKSLIDLLRRVLSGLPTSPVG